MHLLSRKWEIFFFSLTWCFIVETDLGNARDKSFFCCIMLDWDRSKVQ
jgi:hypothetical protein